MGIFQVDPKKKIERLQRRAAAGNMRAQQKLQATKAYEEQGEMAKAPTITDKELAGAVKVGEGVGQAGAQALLQGGMSPATPAQIKAAGEGSAAVTGAVAGQAVGALSKVKEGFRANQQRLITGGGESQWKQNMATAELAMKGATIVGAGAVAA